MRTFPAPDFGLSQFVRAPQARFDAAPADGVLPDTFYSTTNLPTYVKIDAAWVRPRPLRMDAVVVRRRSATLEVLEPRRVRTGDAVLSGAREDASEGIYVQTFGDETWERDFRFMTNEKSRERPIQYERMAGLLLEEKRRGGSIVWVVGPALVHAQARDDLVWFIRRGFVSCLMGGNAIAAHDIEQTLYGTALGLHPGGDSAPGGHAFHVRAINAIRRLGSIEEAVAQGFVTSGILHALVERKVPYILAGSIRDDGPLPGVITDALEAQDAMRAAASRATLVIMVATALHSIAVGNLLPAFVEDDGDDLRPLVTICVDQTEFAVSKLQDRGTHQAFGVFTNAQDFMRSLRARVEQLSPG